MYVFFSIFIFTDYVFKDALQNLKVNHDETKIPVIKNFDKVSVRFC